MIIDTTTKRRKEWVHPFSLHISGSQFLIEGYKVLRMEQAINWSRTYSRMRFALFMIRLTQFVMENGGVNIIHLE